MLERIIKQAGAGLSTDVLDALQPALAVLSSSEPSSIAVPAVLDILGSLHAACRLLASSRTLPSPSARSPALPLELIGHIIALIQSSDDFHERQETNLALSYVSHDLYHLVRPHLRRQIHITRGRHVLGLDKLRRQGYSRPKEAMFISVLVDPSEMSKRGSAEPKDWPGALLLDVLYWLLPLGADPRGKSLDIRVLPVPGASDVSITIAHLEQILGVGEGVTDGWMWNPLLGQVEEARVDHMGCDPSGVQRYALIHEYDSKVCRLYVPAPNPTYEGKSEYEEFLADDAELHICPHPYEVLAVPHAAHFPQHLLGTLPNDPPILRHLEITVILPSLSDDPSAIRRNAFTELCSRLAPSLRRLELRVRHYEHGLQRAQLTTKLVADAVLSLTNLHTLAIGGTGLAGDLPSLLASSQVEDLTFLPTWREGCTAEEQCEDFARLIQVVKEGGYPRLRRLAFSLLSNSSAKVELARVCQDRGIPVFWVRPVPGWDDYYED
ncbi:hypothetical protein BCR35DRAFT_298596 [Leucosporidium creatinivorum]|uniref:Uncharacterized protein n=1 Tax=Leucosporidium creatinivorum TaxID=106004 RepID=A0A1Y2G4T1_9BASI|nr:hypothetical protein BCR35DRAFT_298596 [Leucosporidium creatinivorum]